MLYLVEDRDYIKIGFTTNLKQRKSNYKTDNCYAKFIDWKPGTRADETKLHELCKKWLYDREWFHNVPKIREIWNNYNSDILKEFEIIHKNIHRIIDKMHKGIKPENISSTDWTSVVQSYSYQHFKEISAILNETEGNPYYEQLKQYKAEIDAFIQFHRCCTGTEYSNYSYDFGDMRYEYIVELEDDEYYRSQLKIYFTPASS